MGDLRVTPVVADEPAGNVNFPHSVITDPCPVSIDAEDELLGVITDFSNDATEAGSLLANPYPDANRTHGLTEPGEDWPFRVDLSQHLTDINSHVMKVLKKSRTRILAPAPHHRCHVAQDQHPDRNDSGLLSPYCAAPAMHEAILWHIETKNHAGFFVQLTFRCGSPVLQTH